MALCEGILSNGNQCTNEFNDGEGHLIDGKNICRYCKGRHTKAQRSLRKKAKEEEHRQEQTEEASFDPEEVVECGAKTSCHNTMRHGSFRDQFGAKALNPKIVEKLAREANSEAAKKVSRMFFKRLDSKPPFAVCTDCQQKLEKLWGQPEFLYLDLAYAEKRYEERMAFERKKAEEEERRNEAKAEARRKVEEEELRLAEEIEEMRRKAEEAEHNRLENIAEDFLPDGFEEEEEPNTEEEDNSQEEELSPSDQWLLRVGLGQGDSTEFPFRPLACIENNEVVSCDNPHCGCRGTILDNACNEKGELILRFNSDESIALFWGSFIRTNAHYTRGPDEGKPIIGKDGQPADANSLARLCNSCGRRMRHLAFSSLLKQYKAEGMSYEDAKRRANIEAPSSSPLRNLVRNALRKKRERDEQEDDKGSNGTHHGPRQPNGKTRRDTPKHGTASPQEIGTVSRELSEKAAGVSVKLDLSHLNGNGS